MVEGGREKKTWKGLRPCWRRCDSAHWITVNFVGLARLELTWGCWANNRPPSGWQACNQRQGCGPAVRAGSSSGIGTLQSTRAVWVCVPRAAERLLSGQVFKVTERPVWGLYPGQALPKWPHSYTANSRSCWKGQESLFLWQCSSTTIYWKKHNIAFTLKHLGVSLSQSYKLKCVFRAEQSYIDNWHRT